MENLRKQEIKGTILLEAMLALAIFSMIATLVVSQINHSRKEQAQLLQKEEILRASRMALQTGQDRLSINGIEIEVERKPQQIRVYHQGEELINVSKK